jgi:tRNA (cytidine/uridine-2'-O-)-methyltransferase
MRLALFEPDIPQNTGTLIRLGACMGVAVDIIEPCGFVFSDKSLKRAGMDYLELAAIERHNSWDRFLETVGEARLILLTTKSAKPYMDVTFKGNDILLLGRESAGVPEPVHERADERILIPMSGGARSLNVAIAGAMVLGEALRQVGPV